MAKKRVKKKPKKKATANSRKTVPAAGETVPAQAAPAKSSPTITPYPEAGRKILEFEEQLDRQLGGGDEKRKRGRPPNQPPPEIPEIDITVIGQAIQIPFDLWSVSQGIPQLKIETKEAVMIAKPLKQLLDHYVPAVPEIAWAWISLGAVSYSIMKSRLALIAEIKKRKMVPGKQAAAPKEPPPSKQSPAHFPTIDDIGKPEI